MTSSAAQQWSQATLALVLSCAALFTGCAGQDGDAGDDQTTDAALAAEYGSLPRTVMVGVDVDAEGQENLSSAEMRVPADGETVITSDAAAAAAFASGRRARTAATPSDELDGDTSTQSWSVLGTLSNLLSYKPSAHSQAQPGASYQYSSGTRYSNGSQAIYVYNRPACNSPYCQPQNPGQSPGQSPGQYPDGPVGGDLDETLRAAMAKYGVRALNDGDWYRGTPEQIALGARLFYDKQLSAKNDVACVSCHMEEQGTASVYSLGPTGEVIGGRKRGGFGVNDLLGRNAPALYNVGHKAYTAMFWDGRVARSSQAPSGFSTPAGDDLPLGLDSPLAAQALFPLIASNEMGCGSSAMLAQISYNPTQQWNDVMRRVLARPDYRQMFSAAYPQISQPGIAQLANAIAAFEADRWRADDAPFDRYLRGEPEALTARQKLGATYFYGKGQCATCHAGALQTDHGYHAIAIPQWGPGAGDGNGQQDFGRAHATNRSGDRYKFRTPSLRNVAVTGPWGHNGAYATLQQFVHHYTDTRRAHDQWQSGQVVLPPGFQRSQTLLGAWNDSSSRAAVRNASELGPIPLGGTEIDDVVEFLQALTDRRVARGSQGGPGPIR